MKSAVGAALYRVCTLGLTPERSAMGWQIPPWPSPSEELSPGADTAGMAREPEGREFPPFLFLFLGPEGNPY